MELNELANDFTVILNGAPVRLAAATTAALRDALRAAGVITFAAVVDGAECSDPATLVNAIANGSAVEIRTYAKPGLL